ncbi:MAG TPA: hypothetical protein DDW24_06955 [Blastocatellia bacterium]|nr:hypothetical protein [Blastocatellia bacterium]
MSAANIIRYPAIGPRVAGLGPAILPRPKTRRSLRQRPIFGKFSLAIASCLKAALMLFVRQVRSSFRIDRRFT